MKDNEVKIRVSGEMKDRWQKSALDKGITLSKYIIDRVEGVPTKEKVNVPTNIDVPTEDEEVVITEGEESDELEELVSSGAVFKGSMFKDGKLNNEVNED